MNEERCERTDLIKSQCSHCRGLDKPEVKYDRFTDSDGKIQRGFRARFPGWCEFGDHPIEVDDVIQSHPESFSYVHVLCAEER